MIKNIRGDEEQHAATINHKAKLDKSCFFSPHVSAVAMGSPGYFGARCLKRVLTSAGSPSLVSRDRCCLSHPTQSQCPSARRMLKEAIRRNKYICTKNKTGQITYQLIYSLCSAVAGLFNELTTVNI